MNKLTFFKFSSTAQQPKRGTPLSAGYDLCCDQAVRIAPKTRLLVPTNIGVILPPGTYGRIAPRSGLAYNYGIDVMAGVIDGDYRKPIGVILVNLGDDLVIFNKGDRIAQFIVERCLLEDDVSVNFVEESEAMQLPEYKSDRSGGFGSTGV